MNMSSKDNLPRDEIFQLGVPITRLPQLIALWELYPPKRPLIISPSTKNPQLANVELSQPILTSKIIEAMPEIKIRRIKYQLKTVKL